MITNTCSDEAEPEEISCVSGADEVGTEAHLADANAIKLSTKKLRLLRFIPLAIVASSNNVIDS
jgi:hypothetical protein